MSEERKKVLEMLAAGKITAEEAERLLDKLSGTFSSQAAESQGSQASATAGSPKPKFLRIVVDAPGHEQVNMRVPPSRPRYQHRRRTRQWQKSADLLRVTAEDFKLRASPGPK